MTPSAAPTPLDVLRETARHKRSCALMQSPYLGRRLDGAECDCGVDAALSDVETLVEAARRVVIVDDMPGKGDEARAELHGRAIDFRAALRPFAGDRNERA